jgi:hypothetical protein
MKAGSAPLWSVCVVALIAASVDALAQTADEMNAANNPLQPALGVNLQNIYIDSYYGLADADSNSALLRGVLPHKLFDKPQLLRATLPIVTTPDLSPTGQKTDLGDLNMFDIVLTQSGGFELGIGPQLTIPTAGRDETGTGKWQGGLAALLVSPKPWGLIGGLVTWQHSFAGMSDRRTQNNLQAQPFLMFNLPKAWYLRSTATWTWDLHEGTYYLPIGAGIGKVWKLTAATCNFFVEPQWTVAHDGDGVPKFQIYAGLNLQFPL